MINDGFLSASEASTISSSNKIVLKEKSIIQEKILDAVHNCSSDDSSVACLSGQYCITVAGDTPMTYFGRIESVTVTSSGADYFPVVASASFDNTGSGTGTGATADLTINGDGEITEVTVTNGGSGYVDGETEIVIDHPEGVDFEASVTVTAGEVTEVSIISSGSGYQPLLPEIVLSDTGNGEGAILTPVINDADGSFESVTVENTGYSYSLDTVATVEPAPTSAGTGAEVSVSVTASPLPDVDPYNYYLYLNDQETTCPVKKDIQHIISYFRQKGYTIEAQVNPTTNSTIQWEICWC